MVVSLGNTTFNAIKILIDQVSAATSVLSQLDPHVLALQQEEDARNNPPPSRTSPTQQPPGGSRIPPTSGPGSAPARVIFTTNSFNACRDIQQNIQSGVTRNLLSLYEEESLAGMAIASERAEINALVLMFGASAACTAQMIMSAMAAHGGRSGPALQTGGNTISQNTSDQLNRRFRKNLLPRDWGRALEALKRDNGLRNDFHGQILANGNFIDPSSGHDYESIADYLP